MWEDDHEDRRHHHRRRRRRPPPPPSRTSCIDFVEWCFYLEIGTRGIYERHLQAVPFSSGSNRKQNTRTNNGAREMIEKKIEPWFRRELEAILGDPDPSVIVHVASSFFIYQAFKTVL